MVASHEQARAGRPSAGRAVKAAGLAGPIVLALAATFLLARSVVMPAGAPEATARWLGISVFATVLLIVLDWLARRLLPLAQLPGLTVVAVAVVVAAGIVVGAPGPVPAALAQPVAVPSPGPSSDPSSDPSVTPSPASTPSPTASESPVLGEPSDPIVASPSVAPSQAPAPTPGPEPESEPAPESTLEPTPESTPEPTPTRDPGPANAAPVAGPDGYSVQRPTVLRVSAASGLLANDTDADGDGLNVVVSATIGPARNQGILTLRPDGSFDFTAADGYVGNASFIYTVTDGSSTDRGTVTIRVSAGA